MLSSTLLNILKCELVNGVETSVKNVIFFNSLTIGLHYSFLMQHIIIFWLGRKINSTGIYSQNFLIVLLFTCIQIYDEYPLSGFLIRRLRKVWKIFKISTVSKFTGFKNLVYIFSN